MAKLSDTKPGDTIEIGTTETEFAGGELVLRTAAIVHQRHNPLALYKRREEIDETIAALTAEREQVADLIRRYEEIRK